MSLYSELIVRYASGIWLPIFFTMASNQMVKTIQLATIWKPKKYKFAICMLDIQIPTVIVLDFRGILKFEADDKAILSIIKYLVTNFYLLRSCDKLKDFLA